MMATIAPSFPPPGLKLRGLFLVSALLLSPSLADAQDVQHLSIRQRGGMPGQPVMTGIQSDGTNATVTWDGPEGYYQLIRSSGLLDASWEPVGTLNRDRVATVTLQHSNTFFRVIGPGPEYAGQATCMECHPDVHGEEMLTPHFKALETLKAAGRAGNPACLPCHTTGFGLPTGFISESVTPELAGVQCESCHGPSGRHAANENDPLYKPRVEIAATMCGGCHSADMLGPVGGAARFHPPLFEEWDTSGHATVTRPNMNANSCGRCHIGSARLALLAGKSPPPNDSNVAISCVVCHDPHALHVHTNQFLGTVHTNQLRHPLHSTNDYFLTTGESFANKYDPDIQICAQCHNHRGADWTATSGPPHHSPQYNMLLGTVGVIPEGVPTRNNLVHAGLRLTTGQAGQQTTVSNQCVSCHMQSTENLPGQPGTRSHAGHTFAFNSFDACAECHAFPEALFDFATMVIEDRIQAIKDDLDLWGATRAPAQLRTNYAELSWEYTRVGDLSEGSGPPTALQALIPENIKKARFNLYLVLYDGSFGIHNTPHTLTLLDAAENWVRGELNQ